MKLAKLKKTLSEKELLKELESVKGGRRAIYRNYSTAVYVYRQLRYYGYNARLNGHNGEYCVEW